MDTPRKVLIVEDQRLIAEYFKIVVEHLGYSVCGIAATADEAIKLARDEDPAIVLMDVRLDGKKDGVAAAMEIWQNNPVPMIYITASREPATINRINTDHPSEILTKPVVEKQLKDVLKRFCPQ